MRKSQFQAIHAGHNFRWLVGLVAAGLIDQSCGFPVLVLPDIVCGHGSALT